MDEWEGDIESPSSLHRYLYVSNDAPNASDPNGRETVSESLTTAAINTTLNTLAFSIPFRAIQAAWKVSRGASLASAAQDAIFDVVKDVGFSLLTLGLYRYAKSFTVVRAAGEAVGRAAGSVWNLAPFARGRAIEDIVFAGLRRLHPNFPTVDAFEEGIATSLKSLDLQAASYASTSALLSKLGSYAAKLSAFNGARYAGQRVLEQEIKERVLVVAFEEGAATLEQASALQAFIQIARQQWPNVKVVYQFIP